MKPVTRQPGKVERAAWLVRSWSVRCSAEALSMPIVCLVLLGITVAGCGRQVARLDKLSRVEVAVLTDANALSSSTRSRARPPVQVTDPDRLAALEGFLKKHYSDWKKADGTPRATRFQLELIANDRPLYTIWLEPGYMAVASGKSVKETRLSNADMAELLACLGLPGDYLHGNPMGPGPSVVPAVSPPVGALPAGYSAPGYPPLGEPADAPSAPPGVTAEPALGNGSPPPQPANGDAAERPGSVQL